MLDEENSNLIKKNTDFDNILKRNITNEENKMNILKTPNDEKICKNYIIFSILFILGLIIFLIFGYKSTLNDDKLSKTIEKPVLDMRNFKFIELSNGIKVFLVQDNLTSTSTMSLELIIGFNAENGEIPGISHLLAHLILMNSKSFPNFYFEYFLKNHGGDVNLLIESERTNFYFSVNHLYLEKAIDIFSHHIKEPNFLKETFAETIQLIDKEFFEDNAINNYKALSLLKKISNKENIFSKFFTGNKETLIDFPNKKKIDVSYEIDWYFNEYYSGNLMSIVIISNHSIEFLEKLVKEKFLPLKNNRMPSKNLLLYPKPFLFNQLGKVILFEGDSVGIEMYLFFPMEEITSKFKTKPLSFISSLYNSKSSYSLYSILKEQKLIMNMEAGIFYEASDFSIFYCKFHIPKLMKEKIRHIIRIFYAYTDFLKKFAIKEELFLERKKISSILFNFEEKLDEFFEAEKIAKNIRLYPISNILNGDKLYFDYDENKIQNFLNSINPKNSITAFSIKEFDIDENSIRLQNQDKENEDILENNIININNNNGSNIFRFTDLNSLKEELKILKEKASNKNKPESNKFKTVNIFLLNESLSQNTNINLTDFVEILKIPLDKFDDLNKIYYKLISLSPQIISDLDEIDYGFLNQTIFPKLNEYISSNLNIYFYCNDFFDSNQSEKNLSNLNEANVDQMKNIMSNTLFIDENLNLTFNKICIKNSNLKKVHLEILQYNKTSFPVFYKFETKFNLPRVGIYFDIIFNSSVYTTKINMMFLILSQIFTETVENQLYDFLAAGNFFEIKANHHGFEIFIESFNDIFKTLNMVFFKILFNGQMDEFTFQKIKENLLLKIKEEKFDDPIQKSIKMFQKIMTNYNHIYQEKIYELDAINYDFLENFLVNFTNNLVLNKIFIYGNYLKNDTFLLIDEIIEIFKLAQVSSNNSFNTNLNFLNLTQSNSSKGFEYGNDKNESISNKTGEKNSNIIIDNLLISNDSNNTNISNNSNLSMLNKENTTNQENMRSLFYRKCALYVISL